MGMLIVNPRDGSWWVGSAEDPRRGGWPCDSRDAAIELAHSILAAGGGGEVLIEDRDGFLVRKDNVQPSLRPGGGKRPTLVQMPDGTRAAVAIDPEAARDRRRLTLAGARYVVAGVDLATEPPIVVLRDP